MKHITKKLCHEFATKIKHGHQPHLTFLDGQYDTEKLYGRNHALSSDVRLGMIANPNMNMTITELTERLYRKLNIMDQEDFAYKGSMQKLIDIVSSPFKITNLDNLNQINKLKRVVIANMLIHQIQPWYYVDTITNEFPLNKNYQLCYYSDKHQFIYDNLENIAKLIDKTHKVPLILDLPMDIIVQSDGLNDVHLDAKIVNDTLTNNHQGFVANRLPFDLERTIHRAEQLNTQINTISSVCQHEYISVDYNGCDVLLDLNKYQDGHLVDSKSYVLQSNVDWADVKVVHGLDRAYFKEFPELARFKDLLATMEIKPEY